MSKEISQYLHYYLGCEIKAENNGSMTYKLNKIGANGFASFKDKNGFDVWLGEGWKPILRKLESMTEEEAHEICKLAIDPKYHDKIQIFEIKNQQIHFMDGTKWQGHGVEEFNDCYVHLKYLSATQFHYLLSRGFWLFGNDWFDEGYIIDKATVK